MRPISTFLLFFLLVIGGRAYAQTSTPTPTATPYAFLLPVGAYQFEDLTSPQIQLTGTWTISTNREREFLHGVSASGNQINFYVPYNADYIEVVRQTKATGFSRWEACINGSNCVIYDDFDSNGNENVIVPLIHENSLVTFTTLSTGGFLDLDFMKIVLDPDSILSGAPGTYPTSTPDPSYIYGSVSGTSGDVDTRFDMVVTAGDVAVSSALLFLFFSLWAVILIVLIMRKSNG